MQSTPLLPESWQFGSIFTFHRNFYEKPSRRQYPDYYQLIQRPTSLTDIKKQVEKGRFSTWDAFIAEMRLIWSNAKLYNDDGSQIYLFAEAMEVSSNPSFLVFASLTMEIGMVRRSN
jgi:protein polybromo-1